MGKRKTTAAEADSGSEDLVSVSDEEEEEEDAEGSGDDEEDVRGGGGAAARRADAAAAGAAGAGDDDEEGSDFSQLQVDFEFFDLAAIDFHGLRALLLRVTDGEPLALSALVELLLAQAPSVGTVVKANRDVDPVGVCTVVPLDTQRGAEPVRQLLDFMQRHCPSELRESLAGVVTDRGTGLIINERLLNCPGELAPPLAEGLFREVSEVGEDWWWTAQPGASATMRDAFALRRYLLLTRCYRDDAAGDPTAASAPALVFPKPEDHAMHEACTWSFSWKAAVPEATAASDAHAQLTQLRMVMLVEAATVPRVLTRTTELVRLATGGAELDSAPSGGARAGGSGAPRPQAAHRARKPPAAAEQAPPRGKRAKG